MCKIKVIFVIILAVMMGACSNEQGHYQAVDEAGWIFADTIVFSPVLAEENDTAPKMVHALAVGIRHTNAYEYSNIWVELTTTQAPDTLMRDTFNIRLADDYGHWYGTGIGVGYQKVDTVLRDVWLKPNAQVYLRHIMRTDTLHGIEQAGIIINE